MREFLLKIQKNYWIILAIFFFVFYFSFPVLILYDTGHYMGYVSIFEGDLPFSSWDIVRGPVFPLIIYASNFIFGKTIQGILFLTFTFYSLMVFISYKVLKEFYGKDKKIRLVVGLLFLFLVILNPIVFGYYHTLLTEFIAMTVSIISCYLAWKLLWIDWKKDRLLYLFVLFYFIVMVPFAWFLKQPFVSISLFPLVASVLIQLFVDRDWRLLLQKFVILLLSLASLVGGIFVWNSFLEYKGLDSEGERSGSSFLGRRMITAIENFQLVEGPYTLSYVDESPFLTEQEKKVLTSDINLQTTNYYVMEIYDIEGDLIDQKILQRGTSGSVEGKEVIKLIGQSMFQYPLEILNSYTKNYLASVNVFGLKDMIVGKWYVIEEEFNIVGCKQNCIIATSILDDKTNIYHMPSEMYERVKDYEQYINPPPLFRFLLHLNEIPSIIVFNIALLILPIILIAILIYSFCVRNKITLRSIKTLSLVFILLFYSFLHIVAHCVAGGLLDRYVSPAYITTILGYIGLGIVIYNEHIKGKIFLKRKK
jgi:hypothetical protein